MSDLTPEQQDALVHWSTFGQPGEPQIERFVPDADRRAKLKPIVNPVSGPWPDEFDAAQTDVLLRGFEPGAMEDKWLIYSDDPDDAGRVMIHFHRSWTGDETFRVELQFTPSGSRSASATWETNPGPVATPTERFARDTFVEVCRWVLRMRPAAA